jgi:hypothetical protein
MFGIFQIALAQDLTFNYTDLNKFDFRWGKHTFPVKITNNSEYLKYVAVSTVVKCQGARLSPERKVTRYYEVYPGDTVIVAGILQIPGNYGDITYELKLYDVVDTLDLLLESQVVQKQEAWMGFPVPKEVAALVDRNVTLPPLVGQHRDFDNDFSRLLPFLINDGKSIAEIARMTGCDTIFVLEELFYLSSQGYYYKEGGKYISRIATITEKEAAKGKELALKVAEAVSKKLAVNYKRYRPVIDSLVAAEMLTRDSNSFMDGGAILYKPYPVVTCLSLWYDLGSSFISGDQPVYLFDGTDLCNAHIPNFMYMTAGPIENNGRQHFAFIRNVRSYQFFYGDTIPKIICPEGFMYAQPEGMRVSWEYEPPNHPEGFIADTNQVRPMLDHLKQGITPILAEADKKLESLGQEFNQSTSLPGYRYWFWNLVATGVVETLTADGTLSSHGNGQYRLDGISVK